MRVLHVIATGTRGGGYTHLLGLLPELAKLGLQPSVAVGSDGPLFSELQARGVSVDILDLPGPRPDPRGVLRVARLLARRAPDVVHYHATRAGFFGALRRVAGGPPAVYTVHGLAYRLNGVARPAFFVSEAIICRTVDQVLSVSRLDLTDLERRGFLPPGRGIHMPNAVDARFRPGDGAAARRLLDLPPCGAVVGTVARLAREKSVGDFIDAAARLPGVHVVVVGDGEERSRLRRRAAALGERVRFLGARDDVEAILPAFDVFVLSSLREGEPIALLEAMATDVPCVATSTTGSREIIEPTGAGLLVPPGDPEALAAAVARVLAEADLRRRLVEAGRRAVTARSTYAALAARLADVYAALPRVTSFARTPETLRPVR
jgi:glycosyltransferase involved in cell wall biosynthesis